MVDITSTFGWLFFLLKGKRMMTRLFKFKFLSKQFQVIFQPISNYISFLYTHKLFVFPKESIQTGKRTVDRSRRWIHKVITAFKRPRNNCQDTRERQSWELWSQRGQSLELCTGMTEVSDQEKTPLLQKNHLRTRLKYVKMT